MCGERRLAFSQKRHKVFKVEALKDSLRTYLTHVKIEKPTNMQEISDIRNFISDIKYHKKI